MPKSPSGIQGLDEVTGGGLPTGRPTLICGGAGCGKTVFGLEFLIRGATEYGEPGVFMAFEEDAAELAANVRSLGFDLEKMVARKMLFIDHVHIDRSEIEETGEYDLEGLFVRLKSAIDEVGAKRVVLDTIETLFAGLPNPLILRSELRRLFRWLKDQGMTVVLTGEQGDGSLTRQGLEEYVSDCVIFLDHRVHEQSSTRRLRVVKYRGSTHGTNEYPFLIDEDGIAILPLTSLGLEHRAFTSRVSSGIPRLDEMLGGKGYYKGSSILVSGTAGTGKTSVAALLARAACQRGERCLFFAFEESTEQLVRNMASIDIRLEPCLDGGLLRISSARPSAYGLERHLVLMHKAVLDDEPQLVIVDPITNLIATGTTLETQSMLTRLIDFLKMRGITACFTSLTTAGEDPEQSTVGISSLIDAWLMLEVVRAGGERNRTLTIIKARGMAHSNQSAEFRLSNRGFELVDTYLGPSGVLTGSARLAKEAEDEAALASGAEEIARLEVERERKRKQLEGRIGQLRDELAAEDGCLERSIRQLARQAERLREERQAMSKSRRAFGPRADARPDAGPEHRRPRRGGA